MQMGLWWGVVGVGPILGFSFRDLSAYGWQCLGLAGAFISWEVTPIDMDSNIKYYVMFVFLFQEIVSKANGSIKCIPKGPSGQFSSGMIFLCEIPYPRGQIIV